MVGGSEEGKHYWRQSALPVGKGKGLNLRLHYPDNDSIRRINVTGTQGRRCKQLLNDLKENGGTGMCRRKH
jgi:hypothetical protein